VVASEVAGAVVELLAREGQTVGKGEPLARLRTTSLELRLQAAAAQLKEADSRMKLAERNLGRAQELFAAKIFSQQQLDDTTFEFNAWQGRVEQLTAEIAGIKLDIERCTIRAPFAGVVTRESTEVGEWMDEGGAVVELLSLDELEVRVEVPERYFRSLRLGAGARVTFESLPGVEVSGRVGAIIPSADPQARTFPMKVRIPNRGGRIGAGMLAQVSFTGGETYRATVVPKDAVITRGREKLVYLINGDNTVSAINVETGVGMGVWVEVHGSVQPGQKVVTRGNERLQPGQTVQGSPLPYELP
jgi:RND family efflux transporter MFP subunit